MSGRELPAAPRPEADEALERVGGLSLEVIVAAEGRDLGGVLAGEVGPGTNARLEGVEARDGLAQRVKGGPVG